MPLSFSHPLLTLTAMQFLGSLAFAAMTLVNLAVFGLVMIAIFRRTRAHH